MTILIFAFIICMIRTVNSYSTLHSLIELKYQNRLIADSSIPSEVLQSINTNKDRQAVGDSVKSIQRLQLQLDRSDGRPDFTSDVLAEKYFHFLSTCLRTEGGAWTVTLGPMDYVGLKMKQHISKSSTPKPCRTINLKTLYDQMSSCLIDLPTDRSKISPSLLLPDPQARIVDLSLTLTRIACRCALLSDQLEENSVSEEFELAINYCTHPVSAGMHDLLEMLQLDFGFIPAKNDDHVLRIDSESVGSWIAHNSL